METEERLGGELLWKVLSGGGLSSGCGGGGLGMDQGANLSDPWRPPPTHSRAPEWAKKRRRDRS